MKESDFDSKRLLTRRAVSTLPPPSFSDRKRCHLSVNLHPPQTLTLSWLLGWQVHPATATLQQS